MRLSTLGIASLVLLVRMARWTIGRGLQLVGLVALVVVGVEHRTVVRVLEPHVRSAIQVLSQLDHRFNPPPPLTGAPPIHWPVDSRRVSSRFGTRTNPATGRRHAHRGIDLPLPIGTPVRASRTGVVHIASEDALNGKYVVLLDKASGLRFAYCHLSVLSVRSGQRVDATDIIGMSGNTGRSTGPHLHFGTWFHGRPVDPLRFATR